MPALDRFLKTWASQGPVSPPTDQQADLGWDYIGSAPPTVQQFNALFRWLDEKDNWLYGQIARVLMQAGITPANTPDTQLLTALQTLFPEPDLTYLYNSINEVITNAGLTPDNVDAKLWDAILAYFATKTELNTKVTRTGDTMPYLILSADPADGTRAARRSWVEALVAPKVNRAGDTMDWLQVASVPGGPNYVTHKGYVDGTNGFGANGYKIWPGGFMEQWGVVGVAERPISNSFGVTFPTGFPSYCAGFFPVLECDNAGLMDMSVGHWGSNQWGATVQIGTTMTEGTQTRWYGVRWHAIGW